MMSEYYTHLLISKPKNYVPTAEQVQEFLSVMVTRGAIPSPVEIILLTPSERTRSGVNPFTGKTFMHQINDRVPLSAMADVGRAVTNLSDYEAHVSGAGRPLLPPLPIEFDESYCVTVRCCVSSTTRSTSYVNEWIDKDTAAPPLGTPCSADITTGYFTDPNRGPIIQISDGGCARFWIEIELGKNLFPEIKDRDLNILNHEIVATAERIFATPFVQGYNWG